MPKKSRKKKQTKKRRPARKKRAKVARKKPKNKRRPSVDKRATNRVPVQLKIQYRVTQSFNVNLAHDISPGGIHIQTNSPLPKGTTVDLTFGVPGEGRSISAEGKVVWSRRKKARPKAKSGMGIEFTKIDFEGQRFIDSIINDFLRKVSIV